MVVEEQQGLLKKKDWAGHWDGWERGPAEVDQSTGDQKDLVESSRQAVELEGSRGGLKATG